MALTLPNKAPNVYGSSKQLIAGSDINNISSQLNSVATGLTAGAGGGQAKALQLTAANNIVSTVTTGNDSVALPKGIPGLDVLIQNAGGGNSMQVFVSPQAASGTINNTDAVATGVAQTASVLTAVIYVCINVTAAGAETWISK